MLHLPYFLDISVYVIQGFSIGTSRKFPIMGHDCGPGGYGSPLRLLLSRNLTRRKRKNDRARQSKALMRKDCMTGWMLVKGKCEAVNLDLICVRPGCGPFSGCQRSSLSESHASHAPQELRKTVVEQSCKM